MKVDPYLSFPGNCAEAMSFYKQCLGGGGTLNVMTHRESPMAESSTPEMLDKVLHARLMVDGLTIMASDIASAYYTAPSPMVQLALSVPTGKGAEEVFARLSAGGAVFMPLQQTFWATRFGMLRDKFGVSWMVSCETAPR